MFKYKYTYRTVVFVQICDGKSVEENKTSSENHNVAHPGASYRHSVGGVVSFSRFLWRSDLYYGQIWPKSVAVTLVHLTHRVKLFGINFAPPNSLQFLLKFWKDSKGFYVIVLVNWKGVWKIGVFLTNNLL